MATGAKRISAKKTVHNTHFPGETPAYRTARNQLLKAEADLRGQIETVAALRRKLPLGGVVPEDYVFEELSADGKTVSKVKLSELFKNGKNTLLTYSYMFGPQMKAPCVMCTSILDALEGEAPHVSQRANLAVIAKSPIQRIQEFARGRGWHNLRLLSSASNTYNRDYHGEDQQGDQLPNLNIFVRRGNKIHHYYSTELLFMPSPKGQDSRHVDMIWPFWNLFDLTPEGRGTEWHPRLRYDS